jgi:hypothetical protein
MTPAQKQHSLAEAALLLASCLDYEEAVVVAERER